MAQERRLEVRFFRLDSGTEPVREWLRELPELERRRIGEDLRFLQFAWPVGMPLVRKLGPQLWELRSTLDARIARVLFTIHDGEAVLLHGFIKRSQALPKQELALARQRLRRFRTP